MSDKKVLLTILPIFWPKMPALGLVYLQTFLKNKNINADILDLNNVYYNLVSNDLKKSWLISCNKFLEENIYSIMTESFTEIFKDSIKKMLEYDIVGFSCFKSNFKITLQVAKILKTHKKNIKIILGGPEIARQYFKSHNEFNDKILSVADFLVVGEGEKSLYEYITTNTNNERKSVFNELKNLDDLPFPDFQKIDLKSYPRKDAIPIQFSRGCVRKCNFCSERLLYKTFRARQVENLIEEIRYHLKNNIKYFIFFDSFLNADLKKFEALCDAIINNFGSINWEAQIAVRIDMDKKLFEKIKKSGCYNLFVGLESGSDNTLKNMNKGFLAKDAQNFFVKLNDAGLFFGISLIVGYPGETDKDFYDCLDFVISNKKIIPKIEQINPFTYYDGTNTEKSWDYASHPESIKRMEIFVNEIKKNNLKYTNAFIGNLMVK